MIRIVRMSFQEQYIEDFKQLFEERKERIRHFKGCNYLALWQDKKQKNIFYTYSIWDHESDLDTYRISPLFEETWTQVKLWFNEAPKAFSAEELISLHD